MKLTTTTVLAAVMLATSWTTLASPASKDNLRLDRIPSMDSSITTSNPTPRGSNATSAGNSAPVALPSKSGKMPKNFVMTRKGWGSNVDDYFLKSKSMKPTFPTPPKPKRQQTQRNSFMTDEWLAAHPGELQRQLSIKIKTEPGESETLSSQHPQTAAMTGFDHSSRPPSPTLSISEGSVSPHHYDGYGYSPKSSTTSS